MTEECITKEFQHIEEYVDSSHGQTLYVCKVCGSYRIVWEDSCP